MFKKLLIAFLCVFIMTGVALATNYEEVYNNDFIRGSGSPITETINITLTDSGKLLIKNGSLEDDVIELASSTEVYLDGTRILNPFHIEMGMVYLKDLQIGSYVLELTLKGKPGGIVNVIILEESADGSYTIRYELLPDGTVRDNKTGLIWHRNPINPGFVPYSSDPGVQDNHIKTTDRNGTAFSMDEYINNLNNGVYGTDSDHGNANYSDWRVPTIMEIMGIMDVNHAGIKLSNKYDNGPSVYGDPFLACNWYDGPEVCPESQQIHGLWITQSECLVDITGWEECQNPEIDRYGITFTWQGLQVESWYQGGVVWPVRGPE